MKQKVEIWILTVLFALIASILLILAANQRTRIESRGTVELPQNCLVLLSDRTILMNK